jgi:hypothetical protein
MAALRARKAGNIHYQDLIEPQDPTTSTGAQTPDNPTKCDHKPLTCQQKYHALHPFEKKRRTINKALRKLCTRTGAIFLESWRCVETTNKKKEKVVNLDCFADDGLHLRERGIMALTEYIEGNVQRHLPLKRLKKKKKPKKQTKNVQKTGMEVTP